MKESSPQYNKQYLSDVNLRNALQDVFPDNPKLQNVIFANNKERLATLLIQKTVYQKDLVPVNKRMRIFFLLQMKMLLAVGRKHQELFMRFNAATVDFLLDENPSSELKERAKYVPTTLAEARHYCESQSSFSSYLPIPEISKTSKYSRVEKISEAFSIAIAQGLTFERIFPSNKLDLDRINPRSILQSSSIIKLAKELAENENIQNSTFTGDYIVPFSLWSDKYNSGSGTKGDRSNIKLFSASIVNKPNMTKKHTFPIALIPGKTNKQEEQQNYIRFLYDNLREMKENDITCYDYLNSNVVKIRFMPVYYQVDREEGNALIGFHGANGCTSGMAWWRCPTNSSSMCSLPKSFAACKKCVQRRSNIFHSSGNYDVAYKQPEIVKCPDCFDWDYDRVKFTFLSPFPDERKDEKILDLYDNDGYLSSGEITFPSMRADCKLIYDRVATGRWLIGQAKTYGKAYACLSEANVTMPLIREAKLFLEENKKRRKEGRPILPLEDDSFPEHLVPIPIMYGDVLPLSHYHVGLMHTVALNVGKSMIYLLEKTLSKVSSDLRSTCQIITNEEILVQVRKLSLNWLKVWTQPVSYWWAENYLGFAYVAKSYISIIASTCEEEDDKETAEILTSCFFCWNAMVSMIFMDGKPTDEDADRLGTLIKMFLSYYNLNDSVTKHEETDKKSKIERCSCLQTLLTLPKKMRTFGNLRNLWEGSLDGEGYVRILKPLLKRGIHQTGNLKSVLMKDYRNACMDDALEKEEKIQANEIQSVDEDDIDFQLIDACEENEKEHEKIRKILTTDRYRRFHCYSDLGKSLSNLDAGKPVGVMVYKKRWFILHYKWHENKKKRALKEIKASSSSFEERNHTLCFEIDELADREVIFIEALSVDSTDYLSALLLPMYIFDVKGGGRRILYFMITEEHKEYGANGNFIYPNCI